MSFALLLSHAARAVRSIIAKQSARNNVLMGMKQNAISLRFRFSIFSHFLLFAF